MARHKTIPILCVISAALFLHIAVMGSQVQSFKVTLQSFMEMVRAVQQANMRTLGEKIKENDTDFFYVQKVLVPKDSTIYCWGDIHGDIDSLLSALSHLQEQGIIDDQFNIIADNTYIVSCGDFGDRGNCCLEVIYVLCLLKRQNPDRVFLVRGNHESVRMNHKYGLYEEYCSKFPGKDAQVLFSSIFAPFYASLPSALYVGVKQNSASAPDYIQFCHGGLEFYDLSKLFSCPDEQATEIIEVLHRKTMCTHALENRSAEQCLDISATQAITDNVTPTESNLGFLWSDFNAGYSIIHGMVVPADAGRTYYTSGRGFMFGCTFTEALVKTMTGDHAHIVAIVRAHQHNETMPQLIHQKANCGIYKLFANASPQVAVITTVLTDAYSPTRAMIKIEFPSAQSAAWTMEGLWQSKNSNKRWQSQQKSTFAQWHNRAG